jgi:hypothetical protein
MNENVFNFSHRVRGWRILLLLAALFSLAAVNSALAQSEDGIKAAFVYNFAKFTEWPANAFANDSAPITVGFVGAESLADMFEKNVVGKNANGRDFAVKRLADATGAEICQIIFIGDKSQVAGVLAATAGKPILMIGDSDGFATAGGMINFVKDGAKISFDLNVTAINAVHLNLDAKLRQIARNVKGG